MVRNCLGRGAIGGMPRCEILAPKKIPRERVCTLRACVYCTLCELATFYRRFMGIPAQPLRYATRSKSQQRPGNSFPTISLLFTTHTGDTRSQFLIEKNLMPSITQLFIAACAECFFAL
jgi:hypothetical protein